MLLPGRETVRKVRLTSKAALTNQMSRLVLEDIRGRMALQHVSSGRYRKKERTQERKAAIVDFSARKLYGHRHHRQGSAKKKA